MASHLKTGPKFALVILIAILAVFGLRKAAEMGLIPVPGIAKSLVPERAVIPDVKDAQVQNVTPVAAPKTTVANVQANLVRGEIWEWNAQAGLIYANGGAQTTSGSLMEKHGVNLLLSRQDSTDQMKSDLVSCAKELRDGAQQCSAGANFVVIMGGGVGQFVAGINPLLAKLGPEYVAKAIGGVGFSRGEDACMMPPDVRGNPSAAKGLLIAAVIRDDDWHICQKWAGDNNIKSNPDENTWDPDALNFVNAEDYLKAVELYNSGTCQERKVMKDGHPDGGKTKNVCVGGVATWTPGDVNEAHGKGGLDKTVSTKQYLMPAVIVGPGAFFKKNRDEIEGLLAATFEAGDQLKAFDVALRAAAGVSAALYADKDANAAYWYKYFKGATETDSQGQRIALGGSSVSNLADDLTLFGITPGTNDSFRSVYTVFKNIDVQEYPALFKETSIPEAKDVEDKSYITGAQAKMTDSGAPEEAVQYSDSGRTISDKSYSINFDTGKATFTASGVQTMMMVRDTLAATQLFISIDGYTDDTGSPSGNQMLSLSRALAVEDWLYAAAPKSFPRNRFKVTGHGADSPVASNATAEGKAMNRRVQIALSGN